MTKSIILLATLATVISCKKPSHATNELAGADRKPCSLEVTKNCMVKLNWKKPELDGVGEMSRKDELPKEAATHIRQTKLGAVHLYVNEEFPNIARAFLKTSKEVMDLGALTIYGYEDYSKFPMEVVHLGYAPALKVWLMGGARGITRYIAIPASESLSAIDLIDDGSEVDFDRDGRKEVTSPSNNGHSTVAIGRLVPKQGFQLSEVYKDIEEALGVTGGQSYVEGNKISWIGYDDKRTQITFELKGGNLLSVP